jgi:hypothetical protein
MLAKAGAWKRGRLALSKEGSRRTVSTRCNDKGRSPIN